MQFLPPQAHRHALRDDLAGILDRLDLALCVPAARYDQQNGEEEQHTSVPGSLRRNALP